MKKKIYTLLILVGLLSPMLATAGPVYAVDVFQSCGANGGTNTGAGAGGTDVCKDAQAQSGNPFLSTMKTVISIMALLVGVAAILSLIVGGIKFITAQGDASAVKSARDTVVYSLVGIVVAALAQAIVVFVLSKL